MSETIEQGAAPAAEELSPPAPAPETEAQEPEQRTDDTKWEKRVNRLTSRVTAISRERDDLAGRLAAIEQQQRAAAGGQQEIPPQVQEYIRAEAQKLAAAQLEVDRTRTFHQAGSKTYDDWPERCQNLVAMGADKQFAEMLVEMPDGARVAAELADDPEAVERIAAIGTERGRAIALGQYAAKLESKTRTVSRAPKPPVPVTGRTSPKFDEYTADTQSLVAFYQKQEMEKRRQQR